MRFRAVAASLMIGAAAVVFSQSRALGPAGGAGLRPDDMERVRPGAMAPDFTLENVDGRVVTLSGFRERKHVVLIFYRGHW